MLTMINMVKSYVEAKLGQKGAAMTEYAVILGFVAVVAAVVFASGNDAGIASAIKNVFTKITETLKTVGKV